jgi:hypothetical protein
MSNIPYTTASTDFLKNLVPDIDSRGDIIDFTATDFATLRQALIDYMKLVYGEQYQNFSESDFGMMFAELVAYMGSVMSYKADMLAHEGFIKTAKDRNNVRKLLELIGVRMRGPAGGAGKARVIAEDPLLGESFEVAVENRVISLNSPNDGGPVNYTLYTATGGIFDNPEPDGSIVLLSSTADNAEKTVWTNLALVEGSLAIDRGTFRDLGIIKEVTLQEGPVVEGSIQVLVDAPGSSASGSYTEVESIYSASSSGHRIFSVTYDTDYNATIMFGDGTNGAVPPTNATYSIYYRVGGGERGNAPRSFINTTVVSVEGTNLTLENIEAITGGTDAETVDRAKKYGPLAYKMQERLVSLEDYRTFATRFVGPTGSTAKATASTRKAFSSANIIDVFVLEKANNLQLQKASVAFKAALLQAMNEKKMLTDELVVVDGLIRTVDLAMTIYVDRFYRPREVEIIESAAREATNFFLADNREFGERIWLEEINRAVFNGVDEVKISKIDNLTQDIQLNFNEIIQLNNLVINISYV